MEMHSILYRHNSPDAFDTGVALSRRQLQSSSDIESNPAAPIESSPDLFARTTGSGISNFCMYTCRPFLSKTLSQKSS